MLHVGCMYACVSTCIRRRLHAHGWLRWLCGGWLSLRCCPPSAWPTAATRRDIRLRQERQQGAAQQHEEGLKSWDPTKDPHVAVSVCARVVLVSVCVLLVRVSTWDLWVCGLGAAWRWTARGVCGVACIGSGGETP
jgi:hypothetical protein